MEWNAESVLDALNEFERKSEIPEILDQYLERIAKNGEIVFPWHKLKPLLKKKLEFVLDEFYETCPVETSVPVPNFETFNFENLKRTILTAVDGFTSAPFTIQRLCELVTHPTKHYNRTDKYMRGIEKNVLVVSTVEPRVGDDGNANNPVVVNGGMSPARDDNDVNGDEVGVVSSSSSNHVLLENFANVFPSAACIIPTASDDANFEEEDAPPVERIDGGVTKDEQEEVMDTAEDDHFDEEKEESNLTEDISDESSDALSEPKEDSEEPEPPKEPQPSSEPNSTETETPDEKEVPESKMEDQDVKEPAQEKIVEKETASEQPETSSITEVPQENNPTEPSEMSVDSESSTSSNEPDASA